MKKTLLKVSLDTDKDKVDIEYEDEQSVVCLTSLEVGHRFFVEKQPELFNIFIGIVADITSMDLNGKLEGEVIDNIKRLVPQYRKMNEMFKVEMQKLN